MVEGMAQNQMKQVLNSNIRQPADVINLQYGTTVNFYRAPYQANSDPKAGMILPN